MNKKSHIILASLLLILSFLFSACTNTNAQLRSMAISDSNCNSKTAIDQELKDPPTLHSKNRIIDTTLIASSEDKCINGKLFNLKSYVDSNAGTDDRPVGPAYVLELEPELGVSQLRINFTNKMKDSNQAYDCSHHSEEVEWCTNLHTHGFRVSPLGSDKLKYESDNVFLVMSPASGPVQFEFNLPLTHSAGTHWLHAHLHGSTAPQVSEGMAGALILKGKLDKILSKVYGIDKNKDRIMILQQLSKIIKINKEKVKVVLCGEQVMTSINGQCLPKITVKAGEVNRLRFINSGIDETINLVIKNKNNNKLDLHEFARDGITMEGYRIQKNIRMQPGYRSDLLVKFPKCTNGYPCTYYLWDDKTDEGYSLLGKAEISKRIAKIIINKPSVVMRLPPSSLFKNPYKFVCKSSDTKDWFKICSGELPEEKVYFGLVETPLGSDHYENRVNGKVYPNTATKQLKLNGKNSWKLYIDDQQAKDDFTNHPFHIHVNPFQVVDETGFSYWKDTLLISGKYNKGYENAITVVSEYKYYSGKFVLHCHNLRHEDRGMMMNVEIKP